MDLKRDGHKGMGANLFKSTGSYENLRPRRSTASDFQAEGGSLRAPPSSVLPHPALGISLSHLSPWTVATSVA